MDAQVPVYPAGVIHNQPDAVNVNGIEIAYDSFGRTGDPPILLVAGLGDQLISWPEVFCAQLAACGYWVIRFDNRDAGFSTRFEGHQTPGMLALVGGIITGRSPRVPYSLDEMAGDAVGLLDALEIETAHVLGGSLGGMIAQRMAIVAPHKIKTLTLLMTTATGPWVSPPKPKALVLFKTPPQDRSGYIEHVLKVKKALRGGRFPLDEGHIRNQAGNLFDRTPHRAGSPRQMAAIMASIRSLREGLQSIITPTLVVHGSDDPLIPVRHAIYLARRIPKARLVIIQGLGHDLPPGVWPILMEEISSHAR